MLRFRSREFPYAVRIHRGITAFFSAKSVDFAAKAIYFVVTYAAEGQNQFDLWPTKFDLWLIKLTLRPVKVDLPAASAKKLAVSRLFSGC